MWGPKRSSPWIRSREDGPTTQTRGHSSFVNQAKPTGFDVFWSEAKNCKANFCKATTSEQRPDRRPSLPRHQHRTRLHHSARRIFEAVCPIRAPSTGQGFEIGGPGLFPLIPPKSRFRRRHSEK
jgi:hypothetical protein